MYKIHFSVICATKLAFAVTQYEQSVAQKQFISHCTIFP